MIGFARVGKVESPYEELRTTKRALWLARAERANIQWCSLAKIHPLSMYDVIVQWQWVERKCREKAEEYK